MLTKNKKEKIAKKHRWKNLSVLIALICLTACGSACAPQRNVALSEPGTENADAFLDGFDFQGIGFRIKIAEQNNLLPAGKFWFDSGDDKTVVYGWNEIIYRERAGNVESCNYALNQSGCLQCEWCAAHCSDNSTQSVVTLPIAVADVREIAADGTETVLREFFAPRQGCLLNLSSGQQPFFTAKDDATYVMNTQSPIGSRKSQPAHLGTFVVSGERRVKEAMESYNDQADPALRFIFKARNVNGVIENNYSPNLKVTKVRVLLSVFDPNTGREMIMDDDATLRRVRPSRIIFLPDFLEGNVNDSSSEGTNRCYFDVTKDDGDFNLQTCRRNVGGPLQDIDVTPTYKHGQVNAPLTWVAEYKTSDGLPQLPVLGTNESLTLELTVE